LAGKEIFKTMELKPEKLEIVWHLFLLWLKKIRRRIKKGLLQQSKDKT
jgi:hypothetical protein